MVPAAKDRPAGRVGCIPHVVIIPPEVIATILVISYPLTKVTVEGE